nr:hypothetical protein [Tanacetum cinerariifolium]
MPVGRKISEHIDEFNKIVIDLENIKVKFEDKDLALLLLTYLPASYEHFVDTLLYGREALNLEDVMATLNSKKNKERSKANGDDGEGLYVRGIIDHRDSRKSKGKSRSNSQGGRLKCYIFQSEDHLKRNRLKNNRKKSTGCVKKDEPPSSSGSTYEDFENAMGAAYNWVTTRSVRSETLLIRTFFSSHSYIPISRASFVVFMCRDVNLRYRCTITALRSHAPALYSITVIKFNGSGGMKNEKDLRAGVALCARAAYLGHIDGIRELGHCLQDGYGIKRNISEGRRLLIQANAPELASNLSNDVKEGRVTWKPLPHLVAPVCLLLSDFRCNVPAQEPHPTNKFLFEWFKERKPDPVIRLCSHDGCGRPETR